MTELMFSGKLRVMEINGFTRKKVRIIRSGMPGI